MEAVMEHLQDQRFIVVVIELRTSTDVKLHLFTACGAHSVTEKLTHMGLFERKIRTHI